MQGCDPQPAQASACSTPSTSLPIPVESSRAIAHRSRTLVIGIAVMGLVSLWIDLGRFHHTVHADGLLPVMMSLQKWTPFLWGQDRLGAPIALLATPIRHPLYNLLFQAAVMIWLAILSLPFVARLVGLRDEYTAVGTLSAVLVLALLGRFRLYDLLWIEPYAQSLFFGAVGLLALDVRTKTPWLMRVVGLMCLFMGHYLNLALVLPLLPLAMLRPFDSTEPDRPNQARWMAVLATLGAFFASLACTRFSTAPHESYGPRPFSAWWSAYRGIAAALFDAVPDRTWIVSAGLIVAGAIGILSPHVAPRVRRRTIVAVGCLLLAAASHFLGLVTSKHILADRTGARYAYMSLVLGLTAAAAWALVPWISRLTSRQRRLVEFTLFATLFAIGPVRYGAPSLSGVTRGLRAHSGAIADDVVAGDVRFLVGGYWKVYPALFLANLDRYEQGRREPVWGLTEKAVATRLKWRPELISHARYAMILGDEKSGRFYVKRYHLPQLEDTARTENIRVLQAARPSASAPRHDALEQAVSKNDDATSFDSEIQRTSLHAPH